MKQPAMPADARSPLDAEGFAAATGVSRETLERLETYAALLRRWQARINLVAASTLPDLWRRHMLDSAQLLPLIPEGARTLVDLGSGAGFPGLVLAIMGGFETTLVESDARKAAFLREAARVTEASAEVLAQRIEAVPSDSVGPADVVTGRALAPLPRLLVLAARFAREDTVLLFPKGREVERELTGVAQTGQMGVMTIERHRSATDADGTILRIRGLRNG